MGAFTAGPNTGSNRLAQLLGFGSGNSNFLNQIDDIPMLQGMFNPFGGSGLDSAFPSSFDPGVSEGSFPFPMMHGGLPGPGGGGPGPGGFDPSNIIFRLGEGILGPLGDHPNPNASARLQQILRSFFDWQNRPRQFLQQIMGIFDPIQNDRGFFGQQQLQGLLSQAGQLGLSPDVIQFLSNLQASQGGPGPGGEDGGGSGGEGGEGGFDGRDGFFGGGFNMGGPNAGAFLNQLQSFILDLMEGPFGLPEDIMRQERNRIIGSGAQREQQALQNLSSALNTRGQLGGGRQIRLSQGVSQDVSGATQNALADLALQNALFANQAQQQALQGGLGFGNLLSGRQLGFNELALRRQLGLGDLRLRRDLGFGQLGLARDQFQASSALQQFLLNLWLSGFNPGGGGFSF